MALTSAEQMRAWRSIPENNAKSLKASNACKKRNRPALNASKSTWTFRIKMEAFAILGGKCSSLDCRWLNEDGSLGCVDHRCLQIDHVFSDGRTERKSGKGSNSAKIYVKIIKGIERHRYQLLCACCNWLKRHLKERPSCANTGTK